MTSNFITTVREKFQPSSNIQPTNYLVVASFQNNTDKDMRIFLECTCEEIYLSPNHVIDLLAMPSEDLLPITFCYLPDGIQVYAYREADPDWHIRFKGKIIKPEYPTRLSNYE